MKKEEIKTVSAEKFKQEDGTYLFPFKVLDDTSGGSNLGRIMFQLEPFKGRKTKGRYYIERLYLSVGQTRDERYRGKTFEIPCWSEAITGSCLDNNSYFKHVWRMMFCEVHKTPIFDAYPENHHKVLKINVNSSISIDIDFE